MPLHRPIATLVALIWSATIGTQTAEARRLPGDPVPVATDPVPSATDPVPVATDPAPGASPPTAGTKLAIRSGPAIPALGEVQAARPLVPRKRPPIRQVTPTETPAVDRIALLRQLVQRELATPPISTAKVSLLAWSLEPKRAGPARTARVWPTSFARPAAGNWGAHGAPPDTPHQLLAIQPNAQRVPASNAKLFATTAAATLLRNRYRFVTELSVAADGGPLYVWGTGDPLFSRIDLSRLVKQLVKQGVRSVRGVVVDDGHFGPGRLAPGFEQFRASSRYRPPSGALNLDGNILRIRVKAQPGRKRPRVDVFPASEYVKVRKLIRLASRTSGRAARRRSVQVSTEAEATRMWVVVDGSYGVKARAFVTRRPVSDPSLNFGWALRRALKDKGVEVVGPVWRGRRPSDARVVAQFERPLQAILAAANTNSDNLAAETLIRAIANVEPQQPDQARGSWRRGLRRMQEHLQERYGVSGIALLNGSGLHRNSTVTASALCTLLRGIQSNAEMRDLLLPTLALAGRRGTLSRRLRSAQTAGQVYAKTGTLAGVLALSGLITPEGPRPLAFSLLVNGTSRRRVRRQMDRIVTLLARYARHTLPGDTTAERRRLLAAPTGGVNKPKASL